MEMGSALSICAWFVSVVLVAAALVWFIDQLRLEREVTIFSWARQLFIL